MEHPVYTRRRTRGRASRGEDLAHSMRAHLTKRSGPRERASMRGAAQPGRRGALVARVDPPVAASVAVADAVVGVAAAVVTHWQQVVLPTVAGRLVSDRRQACGRSRAFQRLQECWTGDYTYNFCCPNRADQVPCWDEAWPHPPPILDGFWQWTERLAGGIGEGGGRAE